MIFQRFLICLLVCVCFQYALSEYLADDDRSSYLQKLESDGSEIRAAFKSEVGDDDDDDDDIVVNAEEKPESDEEIESRLDLDIGMTPEKWTEKNKLDSAQKLLFGTYYTRTYDQINKELVDNVPSDEISANMNYIMNRKSMLTPQNFFQSHLSSLLNQLIALTTINSSNRCNRNTYAILYKNNMASRGKARVEHSKAGPMRRLDKIVHKYALNHAIECLPKYPIVFKKVYSSEKFGNVEKFQDAVIENYKQRSNPWWSMKKRYIDSIDVAAHMKTMKGKHKARVAIQVLKELAANDPDVVYLEKVVDEKVGKMVANKDQVKKLVQTYIVKPCELMVRELGPNVFSPMRFDMALLSKDDIESQESLQDPKFLMGRARYMLCKVTIRYRSSLVASIVTEINKTKDEQED